MAIDIRTLATANLVVQLVLIALVLIAVYLARRGGSSDIALSFEEPLSSKSLRYSR
jgi:hypothetical protein